MYLVLPDFWKNIAFWKVHRLRPFLLPLRTTCRRRWVWNNWWNDMDGENPKYWEENLFQGHLVYHKLHMDWPGIEPSSLPWQAGDKPREPWYSSKYEMWRLYLKTRFLPWSKPFLSVIKTRQLTLYKSVISVCSDFHTKHRNTQCVLNVRLWRPTYVQI